MNLAGALDTNTRERRAASGKDARRRTPLDAHAQLDVPADRDPIELLRAQETARVANLVPIRYGRMMVSPFTFYRGAARLMASDLGAGPTAGLRTQLCGDAHLSNFGAYASATRRLVFDINDFDETHPGPFDWDVKRLAASFVVAGRDNGFGAKQCRRLAGEVARHYREAMRRFAGEPILTVWYTHLDVENSVAELRASLDEQQRKKAKSTLKRTTAKLARARTRDSMQAIRKLTVGTPDGRRIASAPPLVVPLADVADIDVDATRGELGRLIARYRATLQSDRQQLLDNFTLTDIAHKVVGVGSVGLRAWILLFETGDESDGLVLQAKQAVRSVVAEFAGAAGPEEDGRPAEERSEGARVVAGQRLMQATSDIFLGWVTAGSPVQGTGESYDYYIRQLRDWKLSVDIEALTPRTMSLYARLCGWTLARAHARAGDRIAIAAYLGSSGAFDEAIAAFAVAYADQNERDYRTVQAAVAAGQLAVDTIG